MSKVIKVDDQVYANLDQLRSKGETFGDIIAMLISARLRVLELWSILEGQLKYADYREEKLKTLGKAARARERQTEEV